MINLEAQLQLATHLVGYATYILQSLLSCTNNIECLSVFNGLSISSGLVASAIISGAAKIKSIFF